MATTSASAHGLALRGISTEKRAGTSIGALGGGLHAAGGLDAYTRWARTLTQHDHWRLLDPAPGLITPVTLNGRLLADGGLTNPIPVAVTGAADADIAIAVSLAEDIFSADATPPSESPEAAFARDLEVSDGQTGAETGRR